MNTSIEEARKLVEAAEKMLADAKSKLKQATEKPKPKHGDYGYFGLTGEKRLFIRVNGILNAYGEGGFQEQNDVLNSASLEDYAIKGNIFDDMAKK